MRIQEIANPPSIEALIEQFNARSHSFVLDSSQSNDGLGQWSFFGADPFLIFQGKDGSYSTRRSSDGVLYDECEPLEKGNGLAHLRSLMSGFASENKSGIPFVGGAVGFIAYDYGRQIERVPAQADDDRNLPDLWFGLYDGVAAFNHKTGVLKLVALGIRDDADRVIADLQSVINSAAVQRSKHSKPQQTKWKWNLSPSDYLNTVEQIKSYIASGDVYQVNLSRRARCHYEGCVTNLYAALRKNNPAPYSALLNCNAFQLLSTSPEQFICKRGRQVKTRPIKGTRPRGATAEQDQINSAALRSSEKDQAELLMIIDLERNDLGRIAEYGSVEVLQPYYLEHYASVMHMTAVVRANLAEGKDIFDCIQALFPGGSITGAPKIRAMEIIEELEPTRRGAYTGSIGYIGFDGDSDFNIAIRSLHLKDGYLDYQVGSGIVWDSKPENEYQETLHKGRAIKEAMDQLCPGS